MKSHQMPKHAKGQGATISPVESPPVGFVLWADFPTSALLEVCFRIASELKERGHLRDTRRIRDLFAKLDGAGTVQEQRHIVESFVWKNLKRNSDATRWAVQCALRYCEAEVYIRLPRENPVRTEGFTLPTYEKLARGCAPGTVFYRLQSKAKRCDLDSFITLTYVFGEAWNEVPWVRQALERARLKRDTEPWKSFLRRHHVASAVSRTNAATGSARPRLDRTLILHWPEWQAEHGRGAARAFVKTFGKRLKSDDDPLGEKLYDTIRQRLSILKRLGLLNLCIVPPEL